MDTHTHTYTHGVNGHIQKETWKIRNDRFAL